MDSELLIALIVLWTSTTMMLVVFLGFFSTLALAYDCFHLTNQCI